MNALPLISIHSARSPRRARNRRFIPESPSSGLSAQLEGRFLTAPALWRFPYGDPRELGDNTWALASGADFLPSGALTVGEDDVTASNSSTVAGGKTIGTINSNIIDLGDPAPPTAPVGNHGISINTSSYLNWSGTAIATPGLGLRAGGGRAYQIADDSGPSTGWKIKETVSIYYIGINRTHINPIYIGVDLRIQTPGLQVRAAGSDTLNVLNVNGTGNLAGQSGSFTTGNGAVVEYTATPVSAYITVTTPLGAIPAANSNPVTGIAWPVGFEVDHWLAAFPVSSATHQMDSNFSFHYDASFTDV